MKKVQGIGASSGIAIATAFRLEHPVIEVEQKSIDSVNDELKRLMDAIDASKRELEGIKEIANEKMGKEKAEIFEAHLLVLNDPELLNAIKDKIESEQLNAEFAFKEVTDMFAEMFDNMDNEYMKERAADIRDVASRVLIHLLGIHVTSLTDIQHEIILFSEDLTPSDTAKLNRQFVKGFVTDIGGRTSHSAIMSRSLEIPAVVGTKTITSDLKNGQMVIVDGSEGQVIIDPTEEVLKEYQEKQVAYEKQKQEWAKLVNEPSITQDGHQVELAANIGTPNDVAGCLKNGAEGIGLYRTEFLYMGRDTFPTEDEQFEAYKTVLEQMNGKPVVVRTLDIGGDKELKYFDLPKEMNPFLGFRAIRLCLKEQEIFRTQLRALLRASVYGHLRIMFPMIATMEDFRMAKAILMEEKEQLIARGTDVAAHIEVGMMVEIPSTAIMADAFAKEVDFFSIGTNDLIQYTFAADRMNERVSYLYQPYNPAILRLVKNVIDAAHKEGKWVGMCGEMAGDAIAVPILLGLGLDEFSMSATSILKVRSQLKSLSKEQASEAAHHLLSLSTTEEVVTFVKHTFDHTKS